MAKKMARQFPEIERILVFGSVARGQAVPGSDVDLLIVLKESSERPLDRIPRYIPSRFPVGVDVFPYTRQELDEMVGQNNFFVKRALKEGVELFRRAS
ncbi:MAG: nucleotidyltransferase domain-containing protein [Chloroflexi bacterium]|nr:nucleotidyltransferase domain-containing protein [Chloroflexota bacterium]